MSHESPCMCRNCVESSPEFEDALLEVARKRVNAEVMTSAVYAADLLAGLPDDPLGLCMQLILTGDYLMAGEKLQTLLQTEIDNRAEKMAQTLTRRDLL